MEALAEEVFVVFAVAVLQVSAAVSAVLVAVACSAADSIVADLGPFAAAAWVVD